MGNVSFVMDLGFTPALLQSPNDNSYLLISDQIPPGRFNSLSDRVADYLQWLPRPIFWRPGQVIDDKDNHSYDCEEEDGGFVDGEEIITWRLFDFSGSGRLNSIHMGHL